MFSERPPLTSRPVPGSRVWASVVCCGATAEEVRPLVAVLEPQVERVLLLDNSPASGGDLAALASRHTVYVPMPWNAGTAGAMNEAWRRASAAGADYFISFDQDSRPRADLVDGLIASVKRLSNEGLRVAAIGPRKVDPRTGRPMRLLLPMTWRRRYVPAAAGDAAQVDHLISSGCLVDVGALREVGPYAEALFLDYVDIEWCLRARARGWAVVCDPRLSMAHVIGDRVVRLGQWSVWVHQPARNGMLIRNHLLLWRSPAVPVSWLLSDLRQVLVKLLVQVCMAPPRGARLGSILRGLRDGLLGRGGG